MTTHVMKSSKRSHHAITAWASLFIPPTAFFASLQVQHWFAPRACEADATLLLHSLFLCCLALSLSGGWMGYREWRAAADEASDIEDLDTSQSALIGAFAFFVSGLFSLIILGQWLAGALFNPCFR